MNKATIAIIGAGNMGTSLLSGLIANQYERKHLWITDSDTEKLQKAKEQFQIYTTTDNHMAIKNADVVILAVKPQGITEILLDLAEDIQRKNPLLISIAAGIREKSIQQWVKGKIAIIRAMPNTPALIGCGATALYANEFVNPSQHQLAESILRAVGLTVWINDEKLMNPITALSGGGPAYFFLIMEVMQNAAIDLGIPKETARSLVLQTALGASRMALESSDDIVELRHHVTSLGGTTEQALHVLESNHIRDIFKNALIAATKRSEELAELFGK